MKLFLTIKNFLTAFFFAAIIIFAIPLKAQQQYPQNYFRSPVDFRIILSGTFGELRSGHFHSGIDIKTGGVQGKKIYAVADGYVSRIKVSATGFGKTLYITHPNGYVSVYAHLSRYNNVLGAYVFDKHYEHESFELNLFPDKHALTVKKGEVVAYSGNSGGSGGPHLHFEMRLASTQSPVNPMLFGFDVKDFITPEINWLKVLPASRTSLIDGKAKGQVYEVDGWGEKHRIKDNDTISVSGPFSLAINTIDKLNDANNKNGVYSITLFADGEEVYYHDLEKFEFHETRYINSLIDYEEYVDNRRRYQRSEIDPNNKLSIYEDVVNDGILSFSDTAIHNLEYVVTDFKGNISRLPIVVQSNPQKMPVRKEVGIPFSIGKKNEFKAENIKVMVSGSCLYRDMNFIYDTLPMPDYAFSRIHRLHDDRTPVQKYYDIEIVLDTVPSDTNKLLVARITDKGSPISYGGKWEDGRMKASVRSFGDYTVLSDTTPPEITSVNIASGKIQADRKTVKVKINDNLSGIRRFRATLNGSWILMDYDAKNALLTYTIDERLKQGDNQFILEVTDQRGNMAVFEKTLVRY
jgi:hypothetical protein